MPYSGERANPYRVRLGLDVPEVGGMNTERSAAAIPPSQFQRLENVNIKGNRLVNRDGLAKVNSSASMTGSVMGIADDRAYGVGAGAAGRGEGRRIYYTGYISTFYSYDTFLTSPLERFTADFDNVSAAPLWYDADDGFVYLNYYDNSTTGGLYRFRPAVVLSPSGTVAAATAAPEKLFATPLYTSGYRLQSICRVGSYIYIGSGSSALGDAKVYRWDGTSLTTEDSFDVTPTERIDTPAIVAPYRNRPVVFYCQQPDSATGQQVAVEPTVRYKADTGTWTAMTFTAGNGNDKCLRIRAVCEYKDKLFIAGRRSPGPQEVWTGSPYTTFIWQLSDTTFSEARNITNTAEHGISGLAECDGNLYYLYSKETDGGSGETPDTLYLGKYDGSTFSDTYATVATGAGILSDALIVQGQRMYAVGGVSGSNFVLYSAALSDLTSWTATATLTGTTSFCSLPQHMVAV